jgi:hypothetical protein
LEVSQGNQISLAIPHSKTKSEGKTKTQPKDKEYSSYDQIVELMAADFNLENSKDNPTFSNMLNKNTPDHGGKWDVDWFNFLKINKQQSDSIASSEAYISLRFILQILMNYIISDENNDERFFKLEIPTYKIKGKDKEIPLIPVTSHVFMLSSSEEVLFPRNKIPLIKSKIPRRKKKKKGTKTKTTDTPPVDSTNEEVMVRDSDVNGTISTLDFHVADDIILPIPVVEDIPGISKDNPDLRIGNALNIFVKYETVVKYWKSTYTRISFIEKVLALVNRNSYGLFNLVYGVPPKSTDGPARPGIFDYRFAPQEVINQNKATSYRFKPTTIKSIVRDFSFNFEMSNLVAGRTIFNSGKFLALAKQQQKNIKDIGQLDLPPEAYKSIDNSTFGNADGWYSINNIEFERIKEKFQQAIAAEKNNAQTKTEDTKTEDTTKEEDDLSQIIKDKSVNFLINENPKSKSTVVLVYKDSNLVKKYINPEEATKNRPTVSPITVTITLDGFSGFSCGQYFNIDGIPEIYNQIGVFQITNTKHNVTRDGWTTTLEADFRIVKQTKTSN